jgi:hypothetical protein
MIGGRFDRPPTTGRFSRTRSGRCAGSSLSGMFVASLICPRGPVNSSGPRTSRISRAASHSRRAASAAGSILDGAFGTRRNRPGTSPFAVDRASAPPARSRQARTRRSPGQADLDVCFVYPPRAADCPGKPTPAFLELRCVALHPAHDGRMRHRQAALGHHLHQVSQTQLKERTRL